VRPSTRLDGIAAFAELVPILLAIADLHSPSSGPHAVVVGVVGDLRNRWTW
jgi:hypothetical protein